MALVLTSISGNLISAASAGYAPTNSGDVSAIASSYQVVSATGTKLYNGTYYLTSVNDNQLSAKYAVSASSATAAFYARYDRQGGVVRSLSSLPGSAEVSAIASSYAESAASSKLDSSASSSFYPADNPSGFISSVDLSDYATTAYVDSSISGFAYDSAVSGWTAKQDALTFGYDTADKISSINGSSLAGEGGGGMVTAIGTSESGITSINNSGLVDTAALRSADYSSMYVQEPLYISAIGDSSYIGISGTQVNADWAETASAAPSYIENKPDLVDIVAGPGIHIDNPDGNTLRVSMAADYEVVLWETTSSGVESGSITVSEAITNFEKYEIYGFETERGGTFVNTFAYSQIPFDYSSIITKPTDNNGQYAFSINMFCAGNLSQWRQTYFGCRCHWNSTFTKMTIDSNHAAYVNKDANGTFNAINQKLRITKIVGIHRIANN